MAEEKRTTPVRFCGRTPETAVTPVMAGHDVRMQMQCSGERITVWMLVIWASRGKDHSCDGSVGLGKPALGLQRRRRIAAAGGARYLIHGDGAAQLLGCSGGESGAGVEQGLVVWVHRCRRCLWIDLQVWVLLICLNVNCEQRRQIENGDGLMMIVIVIEREQREELERERGWQ
jgi:hypothetical protein